MTSNRIELPGDYRCCVCRAKQRLTPVCRRCNANLSLVYRARLRLAYLRAIAPTAETQAEIALLCGRAARNPEYQH
ncbi:MAG: hypothetical protein AAF802_04740 [Planctomycetota bacterium]